jgi:hypothetical protein
MASVTWSGLDELTQALRQLPEHLTAKAAIIVAETGDRALVAIRDAYPVGPTGNLKAGLQKTDLVRGTFQTGVKVTNRAPHAWLFENGTQARHTRQGWNRGVMPPGHVFIPTAMRERTAMVQRLIDLVRGEGFTVTGDAP